jgi:two-component system, response regulator PdtaR
VYNYGNLDATLMHSAEPSDRTARKARILVVEDVANVATVLKARLESYDYDVCDVASTGLRAVASALEFRPDLILMDILLEGDMNGIEAAEQIIKRIDVPIIYLSCVNDRAILERAIHTNPYGFILKPYDNTELHFAIENALIKHRTLQDRENRISELERSCNPDKG